MLFIQCTETQVEKPENGKHGLLVTMALVTEHRSETN